MNVFSSSYLCPPDCLGQLTGEGWADFLSLPGRLEHEAVWKVEAAPLPARQAVSSCPQLPARSTLGVRGACQRGLTGHLRSLFPLTSPVPSLSKCSSLSGCPMSFPN